MEQLTLVITDHLIEYGILEENDRDACRYGLEVMFDTVITLISVIILASLVGNVIETVVFLGSFLVLRSFIGGYHASTRIRCYLLSLIMYGIFSILLVLTPADWIPILSIGGTVVSVLCVWLFAPIVHPNRNVNNEEKEHYRQCGRKIVILEASVILAGEGLFGETLIVNAAALGLSACCFSFVVTLLRSKATVLSKKEGRIC